jgi:hypothetical protein
MLNIKSKKGNDTAPDLAGFGAVIIYDKRKLAVCTFYRYKSLLHT